jgi:RluA family pseudouridine synthase
MVAEIESHRAVAQGYDPGVPKPPYLELGSGRDLTRIPILYEDRSAMAIDKPAGWLLVPFSWQRTQRNLQAAITSSIAAGEFWARSRNLKFLQHVHRLDGDTSGVLLLAKSPGALDTYSDRFERREMIKTYLAVVRGQPRQSTWTCHARLAPDPRQFGRVKVDPRHGKEAETEFKVLQSARGRSLVEASPVTGRTHQIRVHLMVAGHPVVGDRLYGDAREEAVPGRTREPQSFPMGLRAVGLSYLDPFLRKAVRIRAPVEAFLAAFGFGPERPAGAVPELKT